MAFERCPCWGGSRAPFGPAGPARGLQLAGDLDVQKLPINGIPILRRARPAPRIAQSIAEAVDPAVNRWLGDAKCSGDCSQFQVRRKRREAPEPAQPPAGRGHTRRPPNGLGVEDLCTRSDRIAMPGSHSTTPFSSGRGSHVLPGWRSLPEGAMAPQRRNGGGSRRRICPKPPMVRHGRAANLNST